MEQFNYKLYLLLYPDLTEHGIQTLHEANQHWINHGKSEERVSTLKDFIQKYDFDYQFYIRHYNLRSIKNQTEAVFYWLKIGKNLGQVYNEKLLEEKKKTTESFKLENEYINPDYFKINNKCNFLSHLREQKTKITIFKIKTSTNICKGINIDQDIISQALFSLKFSNQQIELINEQDFVWLANNKLQKDFEVSLKSDYYIFSEVILFDLCQYLLNKGKKVVIIPNIDSYETFSSNKDWFANLKILNISSNFHIWSKTKQIYNWINNLGIKNNTYLNFIFFRPQLRLTIPSKENKDKIILLDTGSSLSDRKYINEIANIFHRYNVGFKLVIKTVPVVYQKKKLHLYEQSPHITIVNELMSMSKLDKFYENFGYIIYLSKFDGFGLSLSKAINNNMFIFAGNGLPWSELLKWYPRKCLIKMEQDFSRRIGDSRKGFARSQIYYKCIFSDLIEKLKLTYQDNEHFNKKNETVFFNWINKYIFLSNLYNFLNQESYYNKSCIHMCSYKERSIILLENIVNILFQSRNINIYLNSSHQYSLYFLKKINTINIIPFCRDMKALSKLYCLCKTKSTCTYNFIIDDDIIYPYDYIIHSARIINQQKDSNCVFSYNGFYDKYKLSFMKKHHSKLNGHYLDNIGTGTIFYKNPNLINKKKLLTQLEDCNHIDGIFADNFLSNFLNREGVRKCYFNTPSYFWMRNNSKINLNCIPGLYEYKLKNNLINLEFTSTDMYEEISIHKILYYIEDAKEDQEMEILKKSKLVKLSSLAYFKIIYCLKYLNIRFPSFSYLIIDKINNIDNSDSEVNIISLKTRKMNNKIQTLNKFILSL